MSNSLSDQLLKAGLVTQDQIDQSEQDKQQRKARAKSRDNARGNSGHGKSGRNKSPETATGANRSTPDKVKKAPKKEPSDLAKFYQQRNQLEREEREAEEQLKREAAARRKKVRKQLRELIAANTKNVEDASIRFNFVVGETVKYLYVTEAQQQAIADGELSITFMDGKRCLVPPEIGQQILELDASKIVINFKDTDSDELEQELAQLSAEAESQTENGQETAAAEAPPSSDA
ncbi:MAG: DUF2058 family protein [Thiolinea sp.]